MRKLEIVEEKEGKFVQPEHKVKDLCLEFSNDSKKFSIFIFCSDYFDFVADDCKFVTMATTTFEGVKVHS